jgi:hypothetical protein
MLLVCLYCPCAGLAGFGLPAAAVFAYVAGLLGLPLCGAAPTFLCRRKEK